MIGRKIYYINSTGGVVLTTLQNPEQSATPTTKEQDFQIYQALQAYTPESVDFIQLEFDELSPEFQSATSWKVDTATKQILFTYPEFHPPLITQVNQLKSQNEQLQAKINQLDQENLDLWEVILVGGAE